VADEPAPAVCLFGPTGCGKSALALDLARRFDVEIISVDSAQVYRHMDIGTAKPTAAERALVPHHLLDVREPWEPYSAGDFRRDALRLIGEVATRGRVPLLVGGTMLYFRALFRGLADLPAADPSLRAELDRQGRERGWPALHRELASVDPAAAARIAPSDRQRIQRALEVYRLSGNALSTLQSRATAGEAKHYLRVALLPADRKELYARLDRRLEGMLAAGFVSEVEKLRGMPLMSAAAASMRAVGYRQIWSFLDGDLRWDEARRQSAVATRRLAKRQLTWLRSEPAEYEFDALAPATAESMARVLERTGVSRLDERCNMMGRPLECREHGV
jgi:tRNA dimethylallyltransferase